MRAFIAIAEHPDDPFKSICVQTLAEISEHTGAVIRTLILFSMQC